MAVQVPKRYKGNLRHYTARLPHDRASLSSPLSAMSCRYMSRLPTRPTATVAIWSTVSRAAHVVPAGEIPHVAVQVLGRQFVVAPRVGTLQHRPERLDTLRVGLPPHVLAHGIVDRLMLVSRKPASYRLHARPCRPRPAAHEGLQGIAVRGRDQLRNSVPVGFSTL